MIKKKIITNFCVVRFHEKTVIKNIGCWIMTRLGKGAGSLPPKALAFKNQTTKMDEILRCYCLFIANIVNLAFAPSLPVFPDHY